MLTTTSIKFHIIDFVTHSCGILHKNYSYDQHNATIEAVITFIKQKLHCDQITILDSKMIPLESRSMHELASSYIKSNDTLTVTISHAPQMTRQCNTVQIASTIDKLSAIELSTALQKVTLQYPELCSRIFVAGIATLGTSSQMTVHNQLNDIRNQLEATSISTKKKEMVMSTTETPFHSIGPDVFSEIVQYLSMEDIFRSIILIDRITFIYIEAMIQNFKLPLREIQNQCYLRNYCFKSYNIASPSTITLLNNLIGLIPLLSQTITHFAVNFDSLREIVVTMDECQGYYEFVMNKLFDVLTELHISHLHASSFVVGHPIHDIISHWNSAALILTNIEFDQQTQNWESFISCLDTFNPLEKLIITGITNKITLHQQTYYSDAFHPLSEVISLQIEDIPESLVYTLLDYIVPWQLKHFFLGNNNNNQQLNLEKIQVHLKQGIIKNVTELTLKNLSICIIQNMIQQTSRLLKLSVHIDSETEMKKCIHCITQMKKNISSLNYLCISGINILISDSTAIINSIAKVLQFVHQSNMFMLEFIVKFEQCSVDLFLQRLLDGLPSLLSALNKFEQWVIYVDVSWKRNRQIRQFPFCSLNINGYDYNYNVYDHTGSKIEGKNVQRLIFVNGFSIVHSENDSFCFGQHRPELTI